MTGFLFQIKLQLLVSDGFFEEHMVSKSNNPRRRDSGLRKGGQWFYLKCSRTGLYEYIRSGKHRNQSVEWLMKGQLVRIIWYCYDSFHLILDLFELHIRVFIRPHTGNMNYVVCDSIIIIIFNLSSFSPSLSLSRRGS